MLVLATAGYPMKALMIVELQITSDLILVARPHSRKGRKNRKMNI
jgi:hypothetical protein